MFNTADKNKKLAFHFIFWILYYVLFSIIWAKNYDYRESFYLEFILLPIRIFVVYATVLYLIPQFLLNKRFVLFTAYYVILLLFSGILQDVFLYFFYEQTVITSFSDIFRFHGLIRTIILINSTVFFVSTLYILNLYFKEKSKNEEALLGNQELMELKSSRRTYKIVTNEITYIEGLGNYVHYLLMNDNKITVYKSLKKCLQELPPNFERIHKSYIINKNQVRSYNNDSVELGNGEMLPISSSVEIDKVLN